MKTNISFADNGIILINAAKQSFNMQEIKNRRFMYNPASGALIFGYQFKTSKKVMASHAEEHGASGTNEPYDAFIRGWVGTGQDYPGGVIHFAPPILDGYPDLFDKGFSALELFRENGANGDTLIRGFPGAWEQSLSALLPPENERKENMDRDLDELHTTVDKACAILQRTRDGDDLDPGDLYLTECAVNGILTETGVKKFDELHKRVMSGEYVKPWLHGVEPMTRDHEGYIYYKDKQVEHYSKPYVWSLEAKRDLTELRNQCAYVESIGGDVSCTNVVWCWGNYKDAYGQAKQAEFDRALDGGGLTFSKVVIDNNWNSEMKFFTPGVPDWEYIRTGTEFQDFYKNNDHDHGFEVSIQSYRYGGESRTYGAEVMDAIPSCFDYLHANNALEKVHSQNFNVEPERENESEPEPTDEDEMEGEV